MVLAPKLHVYTGIVNDFKKKKYISVLMMTQIMTHGTPN